MPVPPAQFVVSIDLEMSWGAIHHGAPHDDSPYRQERRVVEDVLAAMERHNIAATWAIVGHLFLDSCSPHGGAKHPELSRPEYGWLATDWYDMDPGSDVAAAPTWYGADLIESIQSCGTPQEIGSHSFGHLIVGDPGCSREAFRTDLQACRAVAERAGVRLDSFVYPRNSIGHLDVLEEAGFTTFRGATPPRFANMPPWRRQAATAVDRVFPLSSAAVHPTRAAGMVNVPHTYLFDPDSSTANRYGTRAWTYMVQRRMSHAVRTSSLFHLWFHTHNLANRPDRANTALDSVFAAARRQIDAGRLENLTMGQVGTRLQSSPDTATGEL
jgi:hypothetical protein